jgi:hypothetical protein
MTEDANNLAMTLVQIMGDAIYSNHDRLNAVTIVAATAIYNAADDHGAKLRALLVQFQAALDETVAVFPHDPEFHESVDPSSKEPDMTLPKPNLDSIQMVARLAVIEAMAELTDAPTISNALEVADTVAADLSRWLRAQSTIDAAQPTDQPSPEQSA